MPSTTEQHHPGVRRRAVFAVLCVATAAYSVLQSLVVPALGVFQHQLRTTPSGAAWILTAFLLSASVSTPVLGRLADLRGKRAVLAAALAAMSAGSLISAAADGLGLMIAGRLVQGLGGAVFPLCFALVRDHVAPAVRPRAFVTVSTVMSVGGAAGTVTAGPLLAALSSRWLFILPAVVSALAAVAVATLVPPAPVQRTGARVGWWGAALLAAWLTLLLLAISMVPARGWLSPIVLGVAAGAVVLLALWLTAEVRARHPLVDVATLSMPTVRATNAATLLLGFGTFGSWMLVPLLVAQPAATGVGFGASPSTVGLVMLPTAAGSLLVMPLNRRLTSRYGPRVVLPLGASVAAGAFLLLAMVHGSLAAVCGAVLLMGAGVGLSFAAVASLVVEAVPLAQTAVSAGINTVMRTIGGSLGASVGASLLTASIGAGGYPSPRAYTTAIGVYAAALAGAAAIASRVPRPVRAAGERSAPGRPPPSRRSRHPSGRSPSAARPSG